MFYNLAIEKIQPETIDTITITFKVPKELYKVFEYKSGQYLTLVIPHPSGEIHRCYSLAFAPHNISGQLNIGVKRVPNGLGSNWMHDKLKIGDHIRVSPPFGRFVQSESVLQRGLLTFAGGSGITPIISLIENSLYLSKERITLFYANRSPEETIYKARLDTLINSFPDRFEIIYHFDSLSGYPSQVTIQTVLQERFEDALYICGPSVFMTCVETVANSIDFNQDNIYVEHFGGNTKPTVLNKISNLSTEAKITIKQRPHCFKVSGGESILQAARRQKIEVPFSCEEGFCGTCRAQIICGDVTMLNHHALLDADIEDGWVLTCQSFTHSPEIELTIDNENNKETKPIRKVIPLYYALAGVFFGGLFTVYSFLQPDHAGAFHPGVMTAGHVDLVCADCHEETEGTFRQNIQAIVAHTIGTRQTTGEIGTQPVSSTDCLACHERPKDRHPISRFAEPRFVEALAQIDARSCITCHIEHTGQLAVANVTFCSSCHDGLEVKNDPIDESHKDLVLAKKWDTCLTCHDFHANHAYETPTKLIQGFSLNKIKDYLQDGPSPYATQKIKNAKESR
ncbi:MAG: ferredoxin--NADP reductase [Halopseudomonas aestusnigri]